MPGCRCCRPVVSGALVQHHILLASALHSAVLLHTSIAAPMWGPRKVLPRSTLCGALSETRRAGHGAVLPPAGTSPHVLACVIKLFLLTLPEPLLTYKCASGPALPAGSALVPLLLASPSLARPVLSNVAFHV